MPNEGYYVTHPEKSHEFNLLLLTKSTDAVEAQLAKNRLIVDNEGFLRSFVQKWIIKNSPYDIEFLLQEARIAFMYAIDDFDLHYGTSIRTFARYRLLDLRESLFEKKSILYSIDELEEILSVEPMVEEFVPFNLRNELEEAFKAVLTPLEAEVVYLHFLEGLKMKNIAMARRCSAGRISVIIQNALPKLKSYLKSKGISTGILELN